MAAHEQSNCWKRIGVWGKETPKCPELEKVIHCYNCQVFKHAGRYLLERELPDDYRQEWAEILAAEKKEASFNTVSVIIFRIENEWLALKTQVLSEVIAPDRPLIHSLPHRRNSVLLGVINIRGEIQLCISLKELLGIECSSMKFSRLLYRRMIIIANDGEKWVFPVEEILGIHRISLNVFENVPATVAKAQSTYTKSIFKFDDKHVAYLDDDLIFFSLNKGLQ